MNKRKMRQMLSVITFLCMSITAFASSIEMQSMKTQQITVKEISLRYGLTKISRQFGAKFTYERSIIEKINIHLDLDSLKNQTIKEILDAILPVNGLDYEPVSENNYIITSAKTGKGNKSLQVSGNAQLFRSYTEQSILKQDTVIKPSLSAKHNTVTLTGRVVEKNTGAPIEGATINLVEYGLFTATDAKGWFFFKEIPIGNVRLVIQYISMVPFDREIEISAGKTNSIIAPLETNALSLKDVQVVATQNRGAGATTSIITQSAIEHLQAASLADVMQLLPGGIARNPDLSKINKFSIRQIDADNMGSLGTAVLINGIPLSNNANMQSTNTAKSGTNASFATTAGSGTDFRQISADNIESIEVIRGVPSVEYGDLTSGAILIKTKAGKSPFEIKTRINPKLSQFWVGKGFALGKDKGTLNTDIDYSRGYGDQRYEAGGYTRLTTNMLYTRQFFKRKKLVTTTGFTYATNLDQTKQDPDDEANKKKLKAQENTFRLNTTGKLNLQSKFSRLLSYTLSANYTIQKSFQQQQVGGVTAPYINALEDTTMVAQYLPNEYLSQLSIEGRPLNLFAKVTNITYGATGSLKHRVLVGAEWKMDANYGAGKTFDVNRPPNPGADGSGNRPRKYSDVPAVTQLSVYVEDNMTTHILNRELAIQAGLRLDKVSVAGTSLSPRINLSYELTPSLSLRAGYGIASKLPTLLYLYPQNAYFDYINLNWFATNPSERLLIGTTRVFSTENRNLRIARNSKKEVGFDWRIDNQRRLTLTAYHEKTSNAYLFSETLNTVKVTAIDSFRVLSTLPGQPPIAEKAGTENRIPMFNTPTNNQINTNMGAEFDLDMGKVDFLRTSFVLNGAYMNSKSNLTGYYFIKKASITNQQDPDTVAIYAPGRGKQDQQFSTTLRVIHHIPELKFIVTLSAQTIWISSNRYLNYDSLPIGYIKRSDGQTVWLDDKERAMITKSNNYLFMNISQPYYVTETWRPLWLFNLRLTKEIKQYMTFSFYVNNVFMNNPIQQSNRWSTSYSQRNIDLFFGAEINIKL